MPRRFLRCLLAAALLLSTPLLPAAPLPVTPLLAAPLPVTLPLPLGLPAAALAQEASLPSLGVCIYNGEDTFISSLLGYIQKEAEGRAALTLYDSQNDQNRQNDQVEALLEQGVDVLIVNPVDRTAAVYLTQMAMRYQKPIVFFNREPLAEDLALYDKAYYVGIDPKEQGLLSGRLAAEYFKTHPQADRNGDGTMQLVILKGEPGHQDAELRTLYAIKALQESGVPFEKLQEQNALWEKSLGQERMAAMLTTFGDRIECVICNNDDMALGAIDALKAAGFFSGDKFMPVLGIDATAPALEALEQGSLYATVFNDAPGQASAAIDLALLLARGETVDSETFSYPMIGKVVYIKSTSVLATKKE